MVDGPATTLIGLAAATLTTAAFVPQLVKVLRSRSADDLSFGMLVVFSAGLLLWLVYGVRAGMLPVVVANAVTLALNLTILGLKVRHGRRRRSQGSN
jgi:MtN3 and saliva related transmembrane protein